MINFEVRDLVALLEQRQDGGVSPEGDVIEQAGVARLAHVRDPAGAQIDSCEPVKDE